MGLEQHFFHPRSLKVILMKGNERMSGQLEETVRGLEVVAPSLHSRSSSQTLGTLGVGPPSPASSDVDGKSKAKPEKDITFRLFVVPS